VELRKSKSSERRLRAAVALLLVLSALAWYQVGVRSRRPASFRRGGAFVATRRVPGGTPSLASGPFGQLDPTTTVTPPAAKVLASTTARRLASSTSSSSTSSSSSSTSTAPGPTSALPRLGTYLWDVNGTEGATGFGSRAFPDTMTMVAHGGGDAGEVVLDIAYSSNHSEREILGFRDNGVFFDFEAGQVRFGPSAQTNQGDYVPPMLQVPLAPAAGQVVKGATQVKAADGSVQRIEDWTVRVLGQETVVIAGQPVPTWKVTLDRQSRPGSSQSVTRSRTYWFDPARHLWVKYTEKMHGQQSFGGITFTYDDNLTATLRSFTAG